MRHVLVFSALALFSACGPPPNIGTDGGTPDSGVVTDSGVADDGGTPDSGVVVVPTPVPYDTVCDYSLVAVDDGQDADKVAAASLVSIVAKKCNKPDSAETVKTTEASAVADNGEVKRDHVAVLTAGGPYINMVSGYAQTVSLVTFNYTNADELLFMKGREVLFNINNNRVSSSHDILLVQMATGSRGNFYLMAYGITAEGTAAAVAYLESHPVHFYTLLEWSGGSDYREISAE